MSKKWIVMILVILVAATTVVAAVHLMNQDAIECMLILQGDREIPVSFEDLDQDSFSGELVDGKGDVTAHAYTGIQLKTLLENKGIDLVAVTGITVTSADNYSVEFTAEELMTEGKLYLAITDGGEKIPGIEQNTDGVQAIVFGDENSRRCVRFAKKITVQ